MTSHPVQLRVTPPPRIPRLHVVIRLALLVAIGMLGLSSVYWALYLAVPALVAAYVASIGGERYLTDEAPRFTRALRWLAGAYAYVWMVTDTPPKPEGGDVDLAIEPGPAPTMPSALLRLVYSIPALALLMILSFAAAVLWIIGALFVLVRERLPEPIADYLTLTLRYQFRLWAYHLSLVDRYPSLEPEPSVHEAPHADAV
jgi:hypothetical protein